MDKQTRAQLDEFFQRVAELNGVKDVHTSFSVDPAPQQNLEIQMQENDSFLKLINNIGVSKMSGQKVGVGVSGPIASRTDTSTKERQPRDVTDTKNNDYENKQTNFDTRIPYATLDSWAHDPRFKLLLANAILRRQALDIIMIGFNGTHAAKNTDLATNPLLQDVNVGWIEKIRLENTKRYLTGLKIGATTGNDYKNLDALVFDMRTSLIEPWYQDDPNLRVMVGRNLLNKSLLNLIEGQDASTEKLATNELLANVRIGGLKPLTAPYFPADGILISDPKNLSRYYLKGGRRRYIKDMPERDGIANFESSDVSFNIEDLGGAAFADKVEFA